MNEVLENKIFKVERTDTDSIDYAEYHSSVVIAKDETEAIDQCINKAGEYYRGRLRATEVDKSKTGIILSAYTGG
ncbi:hypothetical protein COF68_05385 [Bacillus toyonensis]|uniref:hypothetical protein n=1 Tax=Bacillus toyonensis TaxID=155322 RepID=UPI000BFD560C|nr:hypothetical protein [Bacillus toyonensis]PHE64276.1 hypothetical protein COF68_05385 [Bacillus toyonensis]